jgi:hypothetical protein
MILWYIPSLTIISRNICNEKVDRLAGAFNKNPDITPSKMPCPIPNYGIWLIYKDSPVTTKVYHLMARHFIAKDS